MKKQKFSIMIIIFIICVAITGVANIIGYRELPAMVATQLGMSGKLQNTMPKAFYLLLTFAVTVLISLMGYFRESNDRIKFVVADVIVVIANIIMISIQI